MNKQIRQDKLTVKGRSYNSSSIIASYASSSSIAIAVTNSLLPCYVLNNLIHSTQNTEGGDSFCGNLLNKKEDVNMNNITRENTTTVKESKVSNAMGMKLTPEQEKVMQDAKVKAEQDAKVKAEQDAKVKAEQDAKVKAENLNPYFTELMKNISFTLQENITSKLPELFQNTMLRDSFYCYATVDKESHRFIAIAHKAKIENKNSILRSYTLIPENKNLSEIRLTVRRRFTNNDFKYSVISCNNTDDHKVMLTSQLGKERIGTSYEEEKERLEKSVNTMLDKLVKFTESHSKVNVIGKNQKEVREIRKAINKLIDLIDNNR